MAALNNSVFSEQEEIDNTPVILSCELSPREAAVENAALQKWRELFASGTENRAKNL